MPANNSFDYAVLRVVPSAERGEFMNVGVVMHCPALTFLGFSAYWERAIEGGIILAAVSLDAMSVRSRSHAGIVGAQRA